MTERLHLWLKFRRYSNLREWLEASYTREGLERLSEEATSQPLRWELDPFNGDGTIDQQIAEFESRKALNRYIFDRYGGDVWYYCLLPYLHGNETNAFRCLAQLDLAEQVSECYELQEFLVRNAIKTAARNILFPEEFRPRVNKKLYRQEQARQKGMRQQGSKSDATTRERFSWLPPAGVDESKGCTEGGA